MFFDRPGRREAAIRHREFLFGGCQRQLQARPIIEMCRLRLFKCLQNVPCHICGLRVSTTVPLKFGNDLALMQKVRLALANMALCLGEFIEEH